MSQESVGMLGVIVALYALTIVLPPGREDVVVMLSIAMVALLMATAIFEYRKSKRRRDRDNILRDIGSLHMQGRAFLLPGPVNEDAITAWERRLGRFLTRTLGGRFHQRLLTAGTGENRVRLYLSALDRFTAELNSSSFDLPIQYDQEAKILANADKTLGPPP